MTVKKSALPQVMDITHPKNVRPSTNSRPVLVTNRPMIAEDPMITQAAREAVDKNFDQPAGAPSAPLVPTGESAVNRQAKTITPIDVSHIEDTTVEAVEQASEPVITAEITASEQASEYAEQPEQQTTLDESEKPIETTDSDKVEAAPEPNTAKHTTKLQIAETPSETMSTDLALDESDSDEDSDSRPETPEEKQSHNLEALVAKGTYFVPINQVGKRRSRIILAAIVFILVALITLDLLLDMGIISIPGVPHTTYFAF